VTCCAGIGLIALNGCAPAKSSQQFRSSFLPPSPRAIDGPDPEPLFKESTNPNLYVKELPNAGSLPLPVAKGSEIDSRLKKADDMFEAGRRAYQAGRLEEARKLFDNAIDVLLQAPENAPDRAKLERRLDQLVDSVYRFDVNGLGAGDDTDKVVYDKSPIDTILELTFPIDPRLKPKVKEEVQATVSQLPLEESDAVLSYIHFFSSERGKRILTAGLRRSGRYRPLIQRVLDEEGVPQELIYLAQAESGFMPRAVSYKQASGMWQFLSWRGREYGLQVTKGTDDRLDPEKATRAAARHLRDLFGQFGDWYLAMAAYNCGPGCVDRAVQRTGYADFWQLSRLNVLPKQTQNYVPAIIALTIMAKNPNDYGLESVEPDAPIQYETVQLESATNLLLVADALERSIAEIRELNPGVLKSVAPAGYELRVPQGGSQTLVAALDAVPAAKRDSWRMHRVEQGETLATIAKQYRTAPAAIVAANNASISAPEAGDVLLIPASFEEKSAVRTASKKPRSTNAVSRRKSTVRAASYSQSHSKVINRKTRARAARTASVGSSPAGQ
jgi:membrane-bound lytic murein transglycosylase D